MSTESAPCCLHSPLLRSIPGVRHGFGTRQGGVSTGPYASLNCGPASGDDASLVATNRARVASAFGIAADSLFTLRQVHGPGVVEVDRMGPGPGQEGDAMVCERAGVMIGILTADCVPVLFADPERRVVGAAHAGWRGAAAGVIEATVAAMQARGARRESIHAAIGPAIRRESYEIGDEVRRAIAGSVGFETDRLFQSRGERYLFDLPGFVGELCREAGIRLLDDLGFDTYGDETHFFSHRRACHRGDPACGRLLSVIGLVQGGSD
jgi:polyphenol oxidase